MKTLFIYFLLISNSMYPQISSTIILGSFHQGDATNCASISAIKLAIGKFGINGVLKNVVTTATGFHIILKDDSEMDLSNSELETVNKIDYFILGSNKAIFDYARFLYAVMAKRKQQIYGFNRIKRAATHKVLFHQLSMDTEENLHFLGLSNFVKKVDKSKIVIYDQIIITNPKHSVFCSKGIYDKFGTPTSISLFESNHGNSPINQNDNYILD